jgi:hypothetical protein
MGMGKQQRDIGVNVEDTSGILGWDMHDRLVIVNTGYWIRDGMEIEMDYDSGFGLWIGSKLAGLGVGGVKKCWILNGSCKY